MRRILLIALLFFLCLRSAAMSDNIVYRDIIESLIENGAEVDIEAMEDELASLESHPINLNTASSHDLEQLFWLSQDQIDAILLYVYHHPMQTVYELQLVPGLQDFQIRNIVPFVCVVPPGDTDNRTFSDYLRTASHELDLRLDARNIENFSGDPVYGYARYKMDARKMQMGAVFKRDPDEIPDSHSRYGAYLQLNDIGHFRTIVAGDYRANFGLGLAVNSSFPLGKSSYASSLSVARQGLRYYGGTSSSFFRGAGTTVRLGRFDLSGFYSCRRPDTAFQHVAGLNLTYRYNRLRLGLTALEYISEDSLHIRNNYYNADYFRGKRQFTGAFYFQYAVRNLTLLGEVAASENTRWGGATVFGMRYSPVQDIHLIALGRYFSRTYDARYASTFSETTRANDEHGIYLGAEFSNIRHCRFSLYSDFFCFSGPKYSIRDSLSWGYDLLAEADFSPSSRTSMRWRVRAKRKGQQDLYSFRYQLQNTFSHCSLLSRFDANLCRHPSSPLILFEPANNEDEEPLTYGAFLSEQFEYRFQSVPLVAQLRLQGFYIPDYANRIYSFENDVLYAFSIPMNYGEGMRYYANIRYRISDHYSLYLKASDTFYFRHWQQQRDLASAHKTDIHILLRITY